ncbi:hypothetical protein [Parolsenella catena]|uniref:hypothetical protein n=1 Tax=Parolsenella catena TaxID=2003188 RepID=UPI003A938182
MRDKTLFLGNGLNRTLPNGISWQELMERLGSSEPEGANVPFPIEFEQIAAQRGCQIGRRGEDPYKDLRNEIADNLPNPQNISSEVHSAFSLLPFTHVVTTNYDQIFEGQIRGVVQSDKNFGSARNILEPVSHTTDADFYHAHGTTRLKRTLCLGHEHYISLIGKIRRVFYPNGEDNSEVLIDLITGKNKSLGIWPEYMFTNDVAIAGFGLDYCETDIWWLLALRAAIFSPQSSIQSYGNKVVFYKAKVGNQSTDIYDSCHTGALQSLGVEVKQIQGDSYADAYKKIAACISKSWS